MNRRGIAALAALLAALAATLVLLREHLPQAHITWAREVSSDVRWFLSK